jgi:hypothetical protein
MATKAEIELQLADNDRQRENLAAQLGPAQDRAQIAYNAWQSALRLQNERVSASFTASYNGQIFEGPSAVEDYIAAAGSDFEKKRDIRKDLAVEFNALFPIKEQLEKQLETAEDPTTTIKSPEATNESATDAETAEKYADPNNTPSKTQAEMLAEQTEGFDTAEDIVAKQNAEFDGPDRKGALPPGAERKKPEPASAKWAGAEDLRVILRVPSAYLTGKTIGPSNILTENGGILFPYTPQISYDTQASYGSVNPLHSNYTQHFYKNSSVSAIQIVGKFTVQNDKDGAVWLATQHLLRALVKMRFGTDSNAGSPPPVCRLEGYGDYQLRNVPVVVTSFKFELTDSVDYIQVKGNFANSLVPTSSVLTLSLLPMYSRREMQNYSVGKFLSGEFTGKGYL